MSKNVSDTDNVIFTFPYLGGSALSYASWKFSDSITVCPLEYRGHGLRYRESYEDSLQDIAEECAGQIDKKLRDMGEKKITYILYGHSMGAVISWYALNALMEKYHRTPDGLYVSGSVSPMRFPYRFSGFVTEERVNHYLSAVQRVSDRQKRSKAFQKIFYPAIVHDFIMVDDYQCTRNTPVSVPIHAYAANDDDYLAIKYVREWSELTSEEFELYTFMGGHFFIEDPEKRQIIIDDIEEGFRRLHLDHAGR